MQKLSILTEKYNLFKYGIALLLLIIPLYPKFPVFSVGGTYVAIRVEDFVIVALSLLWLTYFLTEDKKAFFKDKINIALSLFLTAGLVSTVAGIFLTQTVEPSVGLLHWARRIEYIVPFFVALVAARKIDNIRFFIQLIFIVVLVSFLYGFGQIHFDFPVISTQNEEYSKGIALRWIPGARLHSTFAGHYDLAAYLVLVFPLLITSLFLIKKWFIKILLFIIFIIPTYWLFLQTESRISFAGFLVGVTVTLWVLKKKVFILPFFVLSFIGMMFLSSLGARYIDTINIYKDKIFSQTYLVKPVYAQEPTPKPLKNEEITIREDRSTSIRLNVEWPRALRAFYKNPFLGTGYSSITLATDNDFLRLLGEVGLIGFLSFCILLLRLHERVIKYIQSMDRVLNLENVWVVSFLGGMIGFLINATFIDVFEASKVAIIFWTLAGITIGICGKQNEKNNK